MSFTNLAQFKSVTFSEEMHLFLNKSLLYAKKDKSKEINVSHVVYSILNDDYENIVIATLEEMKVDVNILKEFLQEKRQKQSNFEIYEYSKELVEIINKTKKPNKTYGILDFFFAILKNKNELTELFYDLAIDYNLFKSVATELTEFFEDESESEDNIGNSDLLEEPVQSHKKNNKKTLHFKNADKTPPAISKFPFLINLNEMYLKNKNKCIGRDNEILILERVLNRKNKKNVLMIGKAGVGKTNIVEGLVQRIMENKTSIYLKDKIILSLDVTMLMNQTAWRGQFEEKITNLLNLLKSNKNYILFIDEIHNILGLGNSGGSLDLVNMLKPAMARDEIQVIGCTTPEEKISLEKDRAFMRRFFVFPVDSPSKQQTIEILNKIKPVYESTHFVKFSPENINLIVELSEKYYPNRNFPDKSIELMDDIGAFSKIFEPQPKSITKLNKSLLNIAKKKRIVFETKDYEKGKSLLMKEKEILFQLSQQINSQKNTKKIRNLSQEDILRFSSNIFNVNIDTISDSSFEKFEKSKNLILGNIKGQDEIVASLIQKIHVKTFFGDLENNTPLCFIFSGKSSVGKTYLGELLGQFLYNNKIKIINGELFKESHSISNLTGSPKGYVDSSSGSDLFEFVKMNPESVILLDEIEKAHPSIYQFLLSIIDKGIVTDKDGTIIDFRRCLILLTTNIGTKKIQQHKPIGFNTQNNEKTVLESELKKYFSPEFLNRVNEVYYFNDIEVMEIILNQKIDKLKKFMKNKGVTLKISDKVKSQILEICKNSENNVRELEKQITKYVKEYIISQKQKATVVI